MARIPDDYDVEPGAAVQLQFTALNGRTTSQPLKLHRLTAATDLQFLTSCYEFAQDQVALWQSYTNAVVTASVSFLVDGIKPPNVGTGDITEVAQLTVALDDQGKKASLYIPAPIIDMFQSTSGEGVDIVEPAYWDDAADGFALMNAIGGATNPLTDYSIWAISDGERVDIDEGAHNGFLRGRRVTKRYARKYTS